MHSKANISTMLNTFGSQDKMAAILQMIFSNAFSWMKIYDFDLYFTKVCFYGSN